MPAQRTAPFEATPLQVKFRTLKMREEEAAKLAEAVDQIMAKADRKIKGGCFAWIGRLFGNSKSYQRSAQSDAIEVASTTAASSSSAAASSASAFSESTKSVEVNSRIFGLAGAKKASDPAKMLEQAASVMRARIEQLEQRAAESRSEAARLVRLGQKQAAMRALKKAKQLESSAAANSASLDAVEQQVDLLAQAAVQKTLTSALETTSKTMKKDKKMVERAEKAVDDVAEVRDLSEELNSAFGELANHGGNDVDEEELEEELEAMMEASQEAVDVDDEAEFAQDAKSVRAKERQQLNGNGKAHAHANGSSSSNSSSSSAHAAGSSLPSLGLPSVPKRKQKEEKAALLAHDAAAQEAQAV